jgi:hypothetical protein
MLQVLCIGNLSWPQRDLHELDDRRSSRVGRIACNRRCRISGPGGHSVQRAVARRTGRRVLL